MKKYLVATMITIILVSISPAFSQVDYETYFTSERMRVDLVFAGNHESTNIYLEKIKQEPEWGGTKVNLLDPLERGDFMVKILDKSSGKPIYSKGFSSLYEEWQTTAEAKTTEKSFEIPVVFPYPVHPVVMQILERNEDNAFVKIFQTEIDPADYLVEKGIIFDFPVKKLVDRGEPSACVDMVFLAEGYTNNQIEKFYGDVERFCSYLFAVEPYASNKEKFNIWAVGSVSAEEGTDIPGEGVWKNTILNTNFYTFRLDRYLTTYDHRRVCDVAAGVPYDQILILVNIDRYGGGGMFNHNCVFAADGPLADKVMVHEFGHGFAGLGDEYYSSTVAYENYFNLKVEPWEPNLTTLVDFDSKWADMLEPDTPVPTPPEGEYLGKTGVFEGGGYVAKGVYRPAYDCRMKSNEAPGFCAVCKRAIEQMIDYYTQGH